MITTYTYQPRDCEALTDGHVNPQASVVCGFATVADAVTYGRKIKIAGGRSTRPFDVSGPSGAIVWSWAQREEDSL